MIVSLPKRNAGLRIDKTAGSVIVEDGRRDYVHVLSERAGLVLERCDGTHTCDQIAHTVAEELQVPIDQVAGEIAHLVSTFADLALIESASVP
jgi:hypothetical protein